MYIKLKKNPLKINIHISISKFKPTWQEKNKYSILSNFRNAYSSQKEMYGSIYYHFMANNYVQIEFKEIKFANCILR